MWTGQRASVSAVFGGPGDLLDLDSYLRGGERKSMTSISITSRIEGQLGRTTTVIELFILITGVHLEPEHSVRS